jgi:hypothetical protein
MQRRQFTSPALLVAFLCHPRASLACLTHESDAVAGVRTTMQGSATFAVTLPGRNDGFPGGYDAVAGKTWAWPADGGRCQA